MDDTEIYVKTILIIDDAINKKYLENKKIDILTLNSNSRKLELFDKQVIRCTHSTMIARIIEKNTKENFKIINIALDCDDERRINVRDLSTALENSLSYDIDIINLSIGSRKLSDVRYLKGTVEKIKEKNIPIICAISNTMDVTIPASLDECIGVINDFDNKYSPKEILKLEKNILGANYVMNSKGLLKYESYQPSNSYSTAFITSAFLNSKPLEKAKTVRFEIEQQKRVDTPKIIFINFQEYVDIVNTFIKKYDFEVVGVVKEKSKYTLISGCGIKCYQLDEIENLDSMVLCDVILIFCDGDEKNINKYNLVVQKCENEFIVGKENNNFHKSYALENIDKMIGIISEYL